MLDSSSQNPNATGPGDNLFIVGVVVLFLGVALGAFGAHGLKDILADKAPVYGTGMRYLFYHGIGILLAGFLADRAGSNAKAHNRHRRGGWLFLAGIVLFTGSLIILAVSKVTWWGAVTPLGGLCFLAGWLFQLAGLLASRSPKRPAA